jgi:chromosomal replication initiation ATPase DnaA
MGPTSRDRQQTVGEQLKLEDEEVSITLRRAWDRALRGLAARVNKPTFEAHIRTLRPLSLAEEASEKAGAVLYVITLGVPSAFTREWVSQRHGPLIQGLLEEVLDHDVRVKFVLTPREKPPTGTAAARTRNLFTEETENAAPAPAATSKPGSRAGGRQEPSPGMPGDLFEDTDTPDLNPLTLPLEPVQKARSNNPRDSIRHLSPRRPACLQSHAKPRHQEARPAPAQPEAQTAREAGEAVSRAMLHC